MGIEMTRTVKTAVGPITYQLEYKSVKNVNLRIRKDGSIYVSASDTVLPERIDEFVVSKADFIVNAVNRFKTMEAYKPLPKQYVSGESFTILGRSLRLKVEEKTKNEVYTDGVYIFLNVKDSQNFEKKERLVTKFLDIQCMQVFQDILNEIYPIFSKYGVEMPILRIRDMDTRWGSCLAKKGIVTLNKRLLEAPKSCIEYVVMHEMCHFIHPNHSKQFYTFLAMLMPDWKQRKQTLDKCAEYGL